MVYVVRISAQSHRGIWKRCPNVKLVYWFEDRQSLKWIQLLSWHQFMRVLTCILLDPLWKKHIYKVQEKHNLNLQIMRSSLWGHSGISPNQKILFHYFPFKEEFKPSQRMIEESCHWDSRTNLMRQSFYVAMLLCEGFWERRLTRHFLKSLNQLQFSVSQQILPKSLHRYKSPWNPF